MLIMLRGARFIDCRDTSKLSVPTTFKVRSLINAKFDGARDSRLSGIWVDARRNDEIPDNVALAGANQQLAAKYWVEISIVLDGARFTVGFKIDKSWMRVVLKHFASAETQDAAEIEEEVK